MRKQTLGETTRYLRQQLAQVAMTEEQAAAETQWILSTVLKRTPEALYAYGEDLPVQPDLVQRVEDLVEKRVIHRIPIQYLLETCEFFGLPLRVTPDVLIPRPETERLVEEAMLLCHRRGYRSILDLGTGSGAIAIALATHLGEGFEITATDASHAALAIARENAKRHGAAVRFLSGDWWDAVPPGERFDLIVANPPYIDWEARDTLLPEVRDQEPHMALFAPQNRLYFYEKTARHAARYLESGGALLLETGDGMAGEVLALMKRYNFSQGEALADYAGIPRIVRIGTTAAD